MPTSIPAPAPRDRHTFDSETTTTWQAEVGGTLEDGVTDVAVGNVSVGDSHSTTKYSFGYRLRYTFQVS
jgi:N-acyl-D-aspartate/D-glutamate deacylase